MSEVPRYLQELVGLLCGKGGALKGSVIYQANGSNVKPMAPTCVESSHVGAIGLAERPSLVWSPSAERLGIQGYLAHKKLHPP